MATNRGEETRQRIKELLAQGLSNTEIAQRLGISRQALHKHLKRIRAEAPAPAPENAGGSGGKVVSLEERQKERPRGRPFPKGHPGGPGRPIKHGLFSEKVLDLLAELSPEDRAAITPDPDLDEQIRIAKAMVLLWARKGKPEAVLVWQDHLRKLALAKAATGEPSERALIVDTAMPGVDRHASS